jgi:hypothetical protein
VAEPTPKANLIGHIVDEVLVCCHGSSADGGWVVAVGAVTPAPLSQPAQELYQFTSGGIEAEHDPCGGVGR